MHDLDMHPSGAGEIDRLGDRREHLVRLVADMGEIGGVVALQHGAEGEHFGKRGEAARRREQTRRHAERARGESLLQ